MPYKCPGCGSEAKYEGSISCGTCIYLIKDDSVGYQECTNENVEAEYKAYECPGYKEKDIPELCPKCEEELIL